MAGPNQLNFPFKLVIPDPGRYLATYQPGQWCWPVQQWKVFTGKEWFYILWNVDICIYTVKETIFFVFKNLHFLFDNYCNWVDQFKTNPKNLKEKQNLDDCRCTKSFLGVEENKQKDYWGPNFKCSMALCDKLGSGKKKYWKHSKKQGRATQRRSGSLSVYTVTTWKAYKVFFGMNNKFCFFMWGKMLWRIWILL